MQSYLTILPHIDASRVQYLTGPGFIAKQWIVSCETKSGIINYIATGKKHRLKYHCYTLQSIRCINRYLARVASFVWRYDIGVGYSGNYGIPENH